ncbi:MAG: alanine:cation symporter family protein [Treponema sp.]|nr:alanine:cation symporter family protein [Candidatus Treponema caballi]
MYTDSSCNPFKWHYRQLWYSSRCNLLLCFLSATMDLGLMWDIADTFNGLMAIPNLIALLLLSGTVVKLTKEHLDKN